MVEEPARTLPPETKMSWTWSVVTYEPFRQRVVEEQTDAALVRFGHHLRSCQPIHHLTIRLAGIALRPLGFPRLNRAQ